jgi:hypothetical protein
VACGLDLLRDIPHQRNRRGIVGIHRLDEAEVGAGQMHEQQIALERGRTCAAHDEDRPQPEPPRRHGRQPEKV